MEGGIEGSIVVFMERTAFESAFSSPHLFGQFFFPLPPCSSSSSSSSFQTEWCWKEKAFEAVVDHGVMDDVAFVQTGYALRLTTSHATEVAFEHKAADDAASAETDAKIDPFSLTKGTNKFCLHKPGQLLRDSPLFSFALSSIFSCAFFPLLALVIFFYVLLVSFFFLFFYFYFYFFFVSFLFLCFFVSFFPSRRQVSHDAAVLLQV